jgi:excisionase family DNA binding protein
MEALMAVTLSPPPDQEFLTITDVAQMLHLSTTTIWRHVRRGDLKALKIGRSYRIRRSDLDALLAAAEVNALAPTPAEQSSDV